MQLSVVILNYNARVFLELCIESVKRATQHIEAEIIVADNDSTDDSMERLARVYPAIKVIRLDDNYGFSKGNNVAVEQARGEYICLVNPDVMLGEKVFENCLTFFNRGKKDGGGSAFAKADKPTGFLGIKLIDGKGNYLPESKRRVPTRTGVLKKLMGIPGSYYDQRLQDNETGNTEILVGAFLMGKREVYNNLGGLDERYFMYGEDIDLSYTAIKGGYENHYLGSQKAIHFKGESTIKDDVYLRRFYGAMHLYYEKHHPRGKWMTTLIKNFAPRFSKKINTNNLVEGSELPVVCVTDDKSYKPDWAARSITFDRFKLQDGKYNKIIFDLKSLELEKVIQMMDGSSQTSNQYRFLTANRTAFAGSDSSVHQGEVKIL